MACFARKSVANTELLLHQRRSAMRGMYGVVVDRCQSKDDARSMEFQDSIKVDKRRLGSERGGPLSLCIEEDVEV